MGDAATSGAEDLAPVLSLELFLTVSALADILFRDFLGGHASSISVTLLKRFWRVEQPCDSN